MWIITKRHNIWKLASQITVATALLLALIHVTSPRISRPRGGTRSKAAGVRRDFDVFREIIHGDKNSNFIGPISLQDPFLPGGGYKLLGEGPYVIIYSVGPDGIDDKAYFAYDATNGTKSTGDIYRRIRLLRGGAATAGTTITPQQ